MSEQPGAEAGPVVAAPPVRDIERLAQDIMAARDKSLAASIGRPQKREIMSFGQVHDCDRNNYYGLAEGEKAVKWGTFVQAKLDAGKARELAIKRELLSLGYEPLMAGEVLEIKDVNGKVLARGRTDLSLQSPSNFRASYPVEVKCMQTHMWSAITHWRDLLRSSWTRKYVRQLMLYMKARGLTEGLFLLDDFNGHWKILVVDMDEAFIADAVAKIERAAEAVKAGKEPPRIPYSQELCGMCSFAHICIPDINSVDAPDLGETALPSILERIDATNERAAENAKLKREAGKFFENIKDGVYKIGNFIVERKALLRTKYDYPDDVKVKYGRKETEYRNKIERFAAPDPDTVFLGPKRLLSLEDEEA